MNNNVNPWIDEHIAAETENQRDGRSYRRAASIARTLVLNEYSHAPKPIPCVGVRCVGTMWYRATVGAMKCPDCGSLAHANGRLISDKSW